MINTMDFARVISAKKMKDTGLERGSLVLVMGTKQVPAKITDPYLLRILTVVAKVEGEEVQIPGEGNEYRAFLVDPRNLERVDEDEQEKLMALVGSN